MTVEEWKRTASKEAVEQFEKPNDYFKDNVKCCHTCIHWTRDYSLMGDYAYNFCELWEGRMTKWDAHCVDYDGWGKEEHLLDYAELEERRMKRRLIDANALRKDFLDLPNCYNGFSDTYDKALIVDVIDATPTVDAIPIERIKKWIEPTVEAIPIEWIEEWGWRNGMSESMSLRVMIDDWRKENEQ